MSFDFDPDAKLNLFGSSYVVNNLQQKEGTEKYIRSMAFDRVRSQLASEIAGQCIKVTEEVYHTRYDLRVYVLTPDQLEKYVQRRAERLRMPGPYGVVEESFAKPAGG